MHLLAHDEHMEDARIRRRRHIEAYGLDHARDVWLQNAEQILDTPHYEVAENCGIFDLDREDYRANARERFMVFWQAPPGDEFVLTDGAFGGFEGGQIGAKKSSQINMTSNEHEQHKYTRDFMWHQLFVLSPTLVVALCQGTLMHPDLTKSQRKRWGLRRSLLEDLPHEIPSNYYKDFAKGEATFFKPGWTLPQDVEQAFGGNAVKHNSRKDDELVFPLQKLSPQQVARVNNVFLHNQERGALVRSVCVRPPESYYSLYHSLSQFRQSPWAKYSAELQNDYTPLIERLGAYIKSMPPPIAPGALHFYSQQAVQPIHESNAALGKYDTRLTDMRSTFLTSDLPRFEPKVHLDVGRPTITRAHSAHSTQSSVFTPSSQSSNSYASSTSSQSSTSTKTTSIDTPRFDTLPHAQHKRQISPVRKDRASAHGSGSDGSGKLQGSKSARKKGPKSLNIVIEHSGQPASYGGALQRGRQPEPVSRAQPMPSVQSKRPSTQPGKTDIVSPIVESSLRTQIMSVATSTSKCSAIPERPTYVVDDVRSRPLERIHTEIQSLTLQSKVANPVPVHFSDPRNSVLEQQHQPSGRVKRSPEEPFAEQSQSAPNIGPAQKPYNLPLEKLHLQALRHARSPESQPPTMEPSHVQWQQMLEHPSSRLDLQPPGKRNINRSSERQPLRPAHQGVHGESSPTDSQERSNNRFEQSSGLRSANCSPERQPTIIRDRYYEASRKEPQTQTQTQKTSSQSNDHLVHVVEHIHDIQQESIHDEAEIRMISSSNERNSHALENSRNHCDKARPESHSIVPGTAIRSSETVRLEQVQCHDTSDSLQHVSETTRGHAYEVVKPEQFSQQAHGVTLQAPSPTTVLQAHQQAQLHPLASTMGSRNTSTSTEHSTRPGVEIVRGRSQPTQPQPFLPKQATQSRLQKLPAPPVVVERLNPNGTTEPIETPIHKQLRFDEGTKGIAHKSSDLSLAGSMVVHLGDRSGDNTNEETDDESWEDEGFAEADEIVPRRPVVRFAEKPMSKVGISSPALRHHAIDRPASRLGKRGVEIQRPDSRLGRRVEIPRPLSRTGQNRKARNAHSSTPAACVLGFSRRRTET